MKNRKLRTVSVLAEGMRESDDPTFLSLTVQSPGLHFCCSWNTVSHCKHVRMSVRLFSGNPDGEKLF